MFLSRLKTWLKTWGKEKRGLLVVVVLALLAATLSYTFSLRNALDVTASAQELSQNIQAQGRWQGNSQTLHSLLVAYSVSLERHAFWAALLQHLASALLISVILIMVVEVHSRELTRRDFQQHVQRVAVSVWEAVADRLLGEQIANQIDLVLQQNVAKGTCLYTITFCRPYPELPNDFVVLRLGNSYRPRNLTDQPQKHSIGVSFIGVEKTTCRHGGKEIQLPRVTKLTIDDGAPTGPREIAPEVTEEGSRVHTEVLLPNRDTQPMVYLELELSKRTTGSEVCTTRTPIEGVDILVINQIPELVGKIGIQVFHPSFKQLCKRSDGAWTFDQALLPGQGFEIFWSKPSATESVG